MMCSSLFRPCPEAATVRCCVVHCLIAAFHPSSGFSTVLEAIISPHTGALVSAEGYIVISLELGFNQWMHGAKFLGENPLQPVGWHRASASSLGAAPGPSCTHSAGHIWAPHERCLRPANVTPQWELRDCIHVLVLVKGIFQAGFSEAGSLLLQWKYFSALNFLLVAHKIAISDSVMSFIKEIPNLQSHI